MKNHPGVECIEHKYCEPGHSTIQEVDNLDSQTENRMKVQEVYSPLTLMRLLKNVNQRQPLVVIQMKACDFIDYQTVAKSLQCPMPYSKLKHVVHSILASVQYKASFQQDNFETVTVQLHGNRRAAADGNEQQEID